MRIAIIILFSCIMMPFQSEGQSPFILKKSVNGIYSDFTVDNLDYVYLFSATGQLKKISATGDSVAVFNDMRRFGKLMTVDVSNPLKALLYYKDFGTVVVLDRFLGKRTTLDLRRLGMLQVKAIGQSYDNGYWVFDEQEARLKHLNESGTVIDQFTDFRILFDSMPSPRYITDQNKTLYLYDESKGVYIFDYYGSFKKRIPITGWKDFSVVQNILLGRDDSHLYRYDLQTMTLKSFDMTPEMTTAIKIKITPDELYVLQSDRLDIYLYKR